MGKERKIIQLYVLSCFDNIIWKRYLFSGFTARDKGLGFIDGLILDREGG